MEFFYLAERVGLLAHFLCARPAGRAARDQNRLSCRFWRTQTWPLTHASSSDKKNPPCRWNFFIWRRGWDSNPRGDFSPNRFRVGAVMTASSTSPKLLRITTLHIIATLLLCARKCNYTRCSVLNRTANLD
ncbi:MAG: hypothetical protein K0S08_1496 [Gammaproteobacteria bacterium]|nr:hypothetical protein [Gammaproteobacteria bacterium]